MRIAAPPFRSDRILWKRRSATVQCKRGLAAPFVASCALAARHSQSYFLRRFGTTFALVRFLTTLTLALPAVAFTRGPPAVALMRARLDDAL